MNPARRYPFGDVELPGGLDGSAALVQKSSVKETEPGTQTW